MRRLSALLFVLLLLAVPITAQDEGTDDMPADLLASLDVLDTTVQELRELEALEAVARAFPTRAEVLTFITESFASELTGDVLTEETQFYRAFNFVDADFDLAATYTDLMGDQVAGFYDTQTRVMNVLLLSDGAMADALPVLERIIYVHEYTHALQDQHFDLNLLQAIDAPDAYLAALALVEGDATLVMQQYLIQATQENPDIANALLNSDVVADAALPQGVPGVLEQELLMPYIQGMFFVLRVWSNGGWEAVDAMYDNLPQSTEQILHPQKYLDGEGPITVDINPVDDVLGSGWDLLYERTLGEFYLGQHMMTGIRDRDADVAAAGWGGDRYLLYYNPATDRNAWVLRLVWDTADDADEFYTAYTEFAPGRVGNDTATMVDGADCWQGEVEAVCLLATTGGETLVATAPDAASASTMIAMQAE